MTQIFLAVVEAEADFRTASCLTRRVLQHSQLAPQWAKDTLEHLYAWSQPSLRWTEIRDRACALGIRAHGYFRGEPGAHDALQARKALLVAAVLCGSVSAVFLVRDSDADTNRRRGLDQARADRDWPFEVVIGLAHPKREAWVLCGFVAETPAEEAELIALRSDLGDHPCERPERLTARSHGAKRDAKRVLDRLTGGNYEREASCWELTDLATLRARGGQCGLVAFLDEVEERILPLLGESR